MTNPAPIRLYNAPMAPSPRRVRMALVEKGISVEVVDVDIAAGDNLKEDFLNKNPIGKVPVLELEDGTFISEGRAIYRYLEEYQPQPALMGTNAAEKATIDMWDQRCEFGLFLNVGMGFQHTSGYFKDRMNPIKEWGEECVANAKRFLKVLDAQLAKTTYIAGESLSTADLTAIACIDFGKVIQIRIDETYPNILRWKELLKSRDSYRA